MSSPDPALPVAAHLPQVKSEKDLEPAAGESLRKLKVETTVQSKREVSRKRLLIEAYGAHSLS